MDKLRWILLALVLFPLVAGCSNLFQVKQWETPTPAPPTPDLEATVEAAVEATLTGTAQTPIAQVPTATPNPTPTVLVAAPTSTLTPTPVPPSATFTPVPPTATSTPTSTPLPYTEDTPVSNGRYTITVSTGPITIRGSTPDPKVPPFFSDVTPDPSKIYLIVCVSSLTPLSPEDIPSPQDIKVVDSVGNSYGALPQIGRTDTSWWCFGFPVPPTAKGYTFIFGDFPPVRLKTTPSPTPTVVVAAPTSTLTPTPVPPTFNVS
jgi:hypothetical protein